MKQLYNLAREVGCHWLELVSDDATILNSADEKRRTERIRAMTPAKRALLDALLDGLESAEN